MGLAYFSLCLGVAPALATAQNLITIDATAPAPAPVPVDAHLGTARNPDGEIIGANSQYLTLDGKPWLPVMGEFHYSRYPEARWEQELLKMKASGVNIISTYIIWIHHEQNEGEFNWSGQRDLRQFVELCRKHGLYVFVRIGPWVHAEVRNGGLPDWVLKNSPVRQNDPGYLREVKTFYHQIGAQLHGEMWKDGGPVIGVQLENEYRATGPGKGMEHIRTLKSMAIEAGLDVPLYTVTGWDGAAIPLDAVLPVFGGYPDAPWSGTPGPLPANEIYAFRFDNRSAGNMGAIGGHGQNAASTYQGTPFLTAEVGDGIEDTYFRRPVVSPDDVAAIAPVMLGSGVNLLGYYMFHGGRNPDGGAITLQESQRTGYPTDVPVRSYDFQAPLGEFGQERESLRKLKLVHYFLNDFGDTLAPMAPRAPDKQPSTPQDAAVPRVSARTLGNAGYLFIGNHVRGLHMPSRKGFQVALKLPNGLLRVPQQPIDLPPDAYGIWPVNLPLGPATLRYSTAQIFKRVQQNGRTLYLFFSLPGVQPEFAFAPGTRILAAPALQRISTPEALLLRAPADKQSIIELSAGVSLLVMPSPEAEKIWRTDDPSLLVRTSADFFADGPRWTLESDGDATVRFGVLGAEHAPLAQDAKITPGTRGPLFREYIATVPPVSLTPHTKKVADAQPRSDWTLGKKADWQPQALPLAPDDADFNKAATWDIHLPTLPSSPALSDVFLNIQYQGDAARLYSDGHLIDDNFWNGLPWTIGLREIGLTTQDHPSLHLRVLPLPQKYPMYIERGNLLKFVSGSADTLSGVTLMPQYRITLKQPSN